MPTTRNCKTYTRSVMRQQILQHARCLRYVAMLRVSIKSFARVQVSLLGQLGQASFAFSI
jgi:hypothetical protein